MFLAVPVIAVIRILIDDYLNYKLAVKKRNKLKKEKILENE